MKCRKCGNKIAPEYKFCTRCGTPVPKPSKSSNGKLAAIIVAAIVLFLVLATAVVFALKSDFVEEQINAWKNKTNQMEDEDWITEKQTETEEDTEEETEETTEYESDTEQTTEYDNSIWDYRFSPLPYDVMQSYYVIFYEGKHDGRIEIAVFDKSDLVDENYIVWNGSGEPMQLYDNSAMYNCRHFYYNGIEWKESDGSRYRLGDDVMGVISSNLDIKNKDGKLALPHITEERMDNVIDWSHADKKDSEYILPESDSRYITEEDLKGLSEEECQLARNEIYARHGRKFDDKTIQSYFEKYNWYKPSIEPDDFKESMLNDYEVANRDKIVAYEKKQGYRD